MCYSENPGLPNVDCKRWGKSLGEVPKGKIRLKKKKDYFQRIGNQL